MASQYASYRSPSPLSQSGSQTLSSGSGEYLETTSPLSPTMSSPYQQQQQYQQQLPQQHEQYYASTQAPSYATQSSSTRAIDGGRESKEEEIIYSSEGEPLQLFTSTRTNRIRPVIFKPNGSFRVLKETGKLPCEPNEAHIYKGRLANPLVDTPHYVPGYTGFVRGRQHIQGRTYGETTRRALTQPFAELVSTDSIPSKPQENRHIPQDELKHTFAYSVFGNKRYHVPGYTGFVPGIRSQFGAGYGEMTNTEMTRAHASGASHYEQGQRDGYAKTQYGRSKTQLSSNPLPGGSTTHQPPDMMIPRNVKYLKYYQL